MGPMFGCCTSERNVLLNVKVKGLGFRNGRKSVSSNVQRVGMTSGAAHIEAYSICQLHCTHPPAIPTARLATRRFWSRAADVTYPPPSPSKLVPIYRPRKDERFANFAETAVNQHVAHWCCVMVFRVWAGTRTRTSWLRVRCANLRSMSHHRQSSPTFDVITQSFTKHTAPPTRFTPTCACLEQFRIQILCVKSHVDW